MVPKYPNLLSANRGDASSFRHSICPKCVRSPSVKRYRSFATLFRRTFESPLSSRKLARMAALSFCTTALSSAMVFDARTLRMNCLTVALSDHASMDLIWTLRELIVVGVEGDGRVFCSRGLCGRLVLSHLLITSYSIFMDDSGIILRH